MSRVPYRFRETELRRAAKAVHSVGLEVIRIDISRNGEISIITGKVTEAHSEPPANEWDADLCRGSN